MEPVEKALKSKLEKEGEKAAAAIVQSNIEPKKAAEQCLNIIKNGAEEFKQKMGREMTYSEMRDLYG